MNEAESDERGDKGMNHMGRLMGVALAWLLFSVQASDLQENPFQNLSAEERFRSTLQQLQQENNRSIQATDNEIRYLENRIADNEAESARKERELAVMGTTTPGSSPEAQNITRLDLDRARVERERLGAELDRRDGERVELAQEQKKLLRLESEYETDPGSAGELMGRLR